MCLEMCFLYENQNNLKMNFKLEKKNNIKYKVSFLK